VGEDAADGDSVYFQSFNRGKRSITLNLQHPGARGALRALAGRSDALFNNLRGDLPSRLGLDYAAHSEGNPRLVCCSLSAFGRDGPRAAEPGYDYLMQGYAGWMSLTGDPDGPPQKAGLSLVDLSAGTMAALGMTAAILHARETGRGGDIDVSLLDTALSKLAYVGAWHLTLGYKPFRTPESSHPSQVPSQILRTADGWLVVMCAQEKFYRSLVERLQERTRACPTAHWLGLLRGYVPCGPVNSVAEALDDPQVRETGMILNLDHPSIPGLSVVNGPIRVDGLPPVGARAPRLGEHTTEVFRGLAGWTDEQVAAARVDGLV
jgi:crotonobetainyl-CoA:carnitine CoA-transferase CaiB-like acyl-CoA transferase